MLKNSQFITFTQSAKKVKDDEVGFSENFIKKHVKIRYSTIKGILKH